MRHERRVIQDHCGIVAAYSSYDFVFFQKGLVGLHVLQTRGYDGAGFWAQDSSGKTYHHKGIGMIREVFGNGNSERLGTLAAKVWVYQVRYGTSGEFIYDNIQPISSVHEASGEAFVVAHNGQFSKMSELHTLEISDTKLFAQSLTSDPGVSWDERIVSVLSSMKGAWSLAVGTKDALYICRDAFGFRPLAYGHSIDGATGQTIWVVASETGALEAMGVREYFELLPGTIAKISDAGLQIISKIQQRTRAYCMFENIYIQHGSGKAHLSRANPRQIQASPTVDDVRRRSGEILAREAPLSSHDVDMVIGVPGTGIEGGMSYARALDIPYVQAITDKESSLTEQRTFMTANISTIYQDVLAHFNFNRQALAQRRVVLVDDSIVRGNISRGLVHLLRNSYGVLAVHLRVLSPPIDKACHLGINTRSSDELIASQCSGDIEKIRISIGAESLVYLSSKGLKEAITGDSNAPGFCMGCMVGHTSPIDQFGNRTKRIKDGPVRQNTLGNNSYGYGSI